MEKAYLKPTIEVEAAEEGQMLCVSVINPGQPNEPASGKESVGDWGDIWDK